MKNFEKEDKDAHGSEVTRSCQIFLHSVLVYVSAYRTESSQIASETLRLPLSCWTLPFFLKYPECKDQKT